MNVEDGGNVAVTRPCEQDASLPPAELLERWQLHAGRSWAERLSGISARIWESASGGPDGRAELTPDRLSRAIGRHLGPGALTDLLHTWESWGEVKARPIEAGQLEVLKAAAATAESIALQDMARVAPVDTTNPYRWLIPCLGGGFLGLTVLGNGNDIAGALGGLLGAAGGIAGVAYLSRNPTVLARTGRTRPSAWTANGSPPRRAPLSKRLLLPGSPVRWLMRKGEAAGIGLAARLLDFVLQPEAPRASLPRETIALAVERAFASKATLTFLLCASQPDREPTQTPRDPGLQVPDSSVLHALTVLLRYLDKHPDDLETIRDMTEELQQRLQDAGYAWQIIPDGTPFRDEYRRQFRLSGLIEIGEPVQTLAPCFRRGDDILLKGRIAKQRG